MNAINWLENIAMKQQDLGLNLSTQRTRNMELPALMNNVVPSSELVAQTTAVAPPNATGRPPFAHEIMLRLHPLQDIKELDHFIELIDGEAQEAAYGLANEDHGFAPLQLVRLFSTLIQ